MSGVGGMAAIVTISTVPCVSSVAGGVVNWTRVLGIVLLRAGTPLMTLRYEQI